jgi:hypothetical protein
MNKKIFILVAFICTVALSGLKAQESVNASSGDISDDGGTVSYSIGQTFQASYDGANGSSSTWIQQAIEILVINNIDYSFNSSINIKAFPNPATENIILSIDKLENKAIKYMLFDYNGKLIEQNNINSNETIINLTHLNSSVYFVKITDGHTHFKTFKIIKK